jgi:hypothetical protein
MRNMKDIYGKRFKIVYYSEDLGLNMPYYQLYIKRIIPSKIGKFRRFFIKKYVSVFELSSLGLKLNNSDELIEVMFANWKQKKFKENIPFKYNWGHT